MAMRIFREIRAGDTSSLLRRRDRERNHPRSDDAASPPKAWPYTGTCFGLPVHRISLRIGRNKGREEEAGNYRARARRLFVAINGLNYLTIPPRHPPIVRVCALRHKASAEKLREEASKIGMGDIRIIDLKKYQ